MADTFYILYHRSISVVFLLTSQIPWPSPMPHPFVMTMLTLTTPNKSKHRCHLPPHHASAKNPMFSFRLPRMTSKRKTSKTVDLAVRRRRRQMRLNPRTNTSMSMGTMTPRTNVHKSIVGCFATGCHYQSERNPNVHTQLVAAYIPLFIATALKVPNCAKPVTQMCRCADLDSFCTLSSTLTCTARQHSPFAFASSSLSSTYRIFLPFSLLPTHTLIHLAAPSSLL